MEFDNNRVLYNIMRIELFATIIFASTFSLAFMDIYKSKFLPLEGYQFALLIVLFFIVIGTLWYAQKQSFFSIETGGPDIVIRYFVIKPKFISMKPKMVVIPKNEFYKYEIETSFLGRRKALILYQKTPKGILKYPPIYVTSLNKEEHEKLKLALQY